METRPLADTGLDLSVLSFGASSIGAEFRRIDVGEALQCVKVALDRGMNYIDTAAYYGRGMSEVMLGQVLPEIPRDSYTLSTKLGRYAPQHFDFSARRVAESIDISLERMRVDHLDIVFCHDIEFVEMDQIVEQGQLDSFCDIQVGDNLVSKMQVAVVVRDGVIESIEQG